MGDMGELFRDLKEYKAQRKTKNTDKWTSKIMEIGAIYKSSGVYQYKDWFLYPGKAFAMNKYDTDNRMSLNEFMDTIANQKEDASEPLDVKETIDNITKETIHIDESNDKLLKIFKYVLLSIGAILILIPSVQMGINLYKLIANGVSLTPLFIGLLFAVIGLIIAK